MATNTTVLVYDLKTQKIYRVESANTLKHHVIIQDTSGQTTPTGEVILSNLSTEKEDNADKSDNNQWLKDQLKEYNVPVLENQNQVDQFLGGEKVDGFPQFDGSSTEAQQGVKFGATVKDVRKERLARYGKKRRGGVLRYPAESLTEHTDYLQIDIEKYQEIGPTLINAAGSGARYVIGNFTQNRANRTTPGRLSRRPLINAGTILLPIPSNLQDSNNVVYGDSRMNGLAAAGVNAVGGAMAGIGEAIGSGFTGPDRDKFGLESVKNNLKDEIFREFGRNSTTALQTAADVITKQFAADAVNIFGANVTVNQLLARGNGEILNPNMELLFSDVTIRNFRFSFKLTPRNPKEAEQVRLIIRAFKRNMAPQAQGGVAGSGNFFLRTPNVFKLRYRSGSKDHPFLNKFKQCFLTDMQTTYTGDGVYATYDDGTPVSMQLDLSFKEIQPIYDVDYDEKPGTGAVGY